jgi:hypothetical protein
MNKLILLTFIILFFDVKSQNTFDYTLELIPINITNLPGLHSYAFGQHQGKWLFIGGRKDGIHARQPFNAFPANNNNANIYVVDYQTNQLWSTNLSVLSTGIREQLQSTNMNFYQDGNNLYIIGGYAFSNTANDHITFDKLTAIDVSGLINAIINNQPITSFFKQISHANFAITGGQLGKINDTFYLIGGHRFDGRYNPMNNPTFTQTYSNQIRKFKINNTGSDLSFYDYESITDGVHLRRRDYNLLPQIFPDGNFGYTISAGVFQIGVDLPFLYPVDIKSSGYTPVTTFNQYLSHYHGAKACLHDQVENKMYNLFFGGISQYYYNNSGQLVQDNNVPFVKTISLVERLGDGTLNEFLLPIEMPGLKGAGSEFIPNLNISHHLSKIVKLNDITEDEFIIGHIFGGIETNSINPFSNNQTNTTSASSNVYGVKLIKQPLNIKPVDGLNPFDLIVFPLPINDKINLQLNKLPVNKLCYLLTNPLGQIIDKGKLDHTKTKHDIDVNHLPSQTLFLTVIVDDKFYLNKTLIKK